MLPGIPDHPGDRPFHDDDRTTLVPQVRVRRFGRVRFLLPWVGFGVVAVAVVAGTTALSSTLRGPQGPLLMNAAPPAVTVAQTPDSAAAPPTGPTTPDAPTTVAHRSRTSRGAAPRTPAPVVPPPTTVRPAPTTSAAPRTTVRATPSKTRVAVAPTTTKPSGVF